MFYHLTVVNDQLVQQMNYPYNVFDLKLLIFLYNQKINYSSMLINKLLYDIDYQIKPIKHTTLKINDVSTDIITDDNCIWKYGFKLT